jgi:hypothetical protein
VADRVPIELTGPADRLDRHTAERGVNRRTARRHRSAIRAGSRGVDGTGRGACQPSARCHRRVLESGRRRGAGGHALYPHRHDSRGGSSGRRSRDRSRASRGECHWIDVHGTSGGWQDLAGAKADGAHGGAGGHALESRLYLARLLQGDGGVRSSVWHDSPVDRKPHGRGLRSGLGIHNSPPAARALRRRLGRS